MNLRAATIGVALVASLMLTASQAATIPEAAMQAGDFASLLGATKTAGLDGYMAGKGPFTIFAPNDAAFAKVPKAKLDMLMQPANRTMLKVTLGNHVVTGILSPQAIEQGLAESDAVSVNAINNMALTIKKEGGVLTVNGAHVIKPPMRVDNGMIYVIDTVLLPAKHLQPTY